MWDLLLLLRFVPRNFSHIGVRVGLGFESFAYLSLPGVVLVVLEHLLVRLRPLDARGATGPSPRFSSTIKLLST